MTGLVVGDKMAGAGIVVSGTGAAAGMGCVGCGDSLSCSIIWDPERWSRLLCSMIESEA